MMRAPGSASADAELLARVPALQAYVRRINARQRSFRSYVVEGEQTYGRLRRPLAIIKIDESGIITCSTEEHEPTEEERGAITAQVVLAQWPRSIVATKANVKQLHQQIIGSSEALFEFPTQDGDGFLFIQQRVQQADGGKHDLPWSYWSDGRWRMMEPDGKLPLCGLDRINTGLPLMLHEGAKKAKHVRQLLEQPRLLAAHPWGADLARFSHLGWPGGAFRARDVDWSPIKQLPKWQRLVLVADHDYPGESAVPEISRLLQREVSALRFDSRFPENFDLADQFPASLWQKERYRGPSLELCLQPVTWATRVVHVDKKGRPSIVLRDDFVATWYYSVNPAKFIPRNNTSLRYDAEEFNALVAPFSDAKDTATLLREEWPAQAATTVYEPGQPAGLINVDGKHSINIYRPSSIMPCEGDVTLWEDFLKHLIPVEGDRKEVKRWCATLIALPGVRIRFGLLLISQAQGVGKGTLGEKILAPLVGAHNCSFPSAQQLTESDFNSWRVHKRLTVVHELYDGETSKPYNRLKSAISDDYSDFHEKHEKPRTDQNNWIHVLACSNSTKPLKLANDDRRWEVPKVTEEKQPLKYWQELNEWLVAGRGLEAIAYWAAEYVKVEGNAVQTGESAPTTQSKKETIHAARSDGEKLVYALGMTLAKKRPEALMRLDETRLWLAAMKSRDGKYGGDGSKYLETPETISRVLHECGLKTSGKKFFSANQRFRVVSVAEIPANTTWADLEPKVMKPVEVWELYDEKADFDLWMW